MGSDAPASDLKHLGIFKSYATYSIEKTVNLASVAYGVGKLLIPVGLVPVANALEGKVVVLGSPLIASIQSRGNSLLQAADTCVDHFLGATKTYSSAAGGSLQTYQAKGVKALQQARASVELTTKQALEYMKKEGVVGAVQQAMDTMKVRSLELKEQVTVFGAVCVDFIKMVLDQLLKKGQEAAAFVKEKWREVDSHPFVVKLKKQAQSLLNAAGVRWVIVA